MPKEKAKHMPKRAPRRFSSRKVIAIGGTMVVLCIVYLILSPLPTPAIIVQTSLPEELRPLAEDVLATVNSNDRVHITDDILLELELWEHGIHTDLSHSICIKYFVAEGTPYDRLSHIFVNGQKVNNISSGPILLYGLSGTTRFSRCVEGNLEAGLHLIEFHLRDSMWGEPVAIQRWAIEIE